MYVNRTPPNSSITHADSAPNLCEIDAENFASRKRKHDEQDVFNLFSEMRKMFEDWKFQQDTQNKFLRDSIKEIRDQSCQIQESINFVSCSQSEITNRMIELENANKQNISYIQQLENRLDQMERASRLSSVEIRNIPSKKTETKDELTSLVINAGKAVNMIIEPSNIKDVFRTNPKSGIKPVIVDFTTVVLKEKFIQATKTFNRDNYQNKLSSSHLNIDGPPAPIFVSDNLTPKMKRLHFLARDFTRTYNYKYCWVAHGYVYVRKQDGNPAIRVNSESDLEKIKPKD